MEIREYAEALCWDTAATLDDVREAVTTLEETLPTARRVLGGAHPFTVEVERNLGDVRAALRARETPPPGARNIFEGRVASIARRRFDKYPYP